MGSISYSPIPCLKHCNLKHLDRDDHPIYMHPVDFIEKERTANGSASIHTIKAGTGIYFRPTTAQKWWAFIYPAEKLLAYIINIQKAVNMNIDYTISLELTKLKLYIDTYHALVIYNPFDHDVNVYLAVAILNE